MRNAYSKKYYETHVKPFVDAEIGDRDVDRTERFAIMNKLLNCRESRRKLDLTFENARQAWDAEKEL